MVEYKHRGESIDYTPTAELKFGDVVSLNTRVGIAAADIPANTVGALAVTGVWAFPKAAGAIAVGAAVSYDTAKKVAGTAEGGIPAGWCVKAAADADTTVWVKIG